MGKNPARIRSTDIRKVMLAEKDGGTWFRRHFLILMTACIIENSGNGYVNPMVIDYFEDTDSVKKLNWCQYVINSLIEHALDWMKSKSRPFQGPMIFLMVRCIIIKHCIFIDDYICVKF